MGEIKLITPAQGQKNWGNAINNNFQVLYNKYRANLVELQAVKDRIEELDTLKTSNTEFIYIPSKLMPTDKAIAYIEEIKNWDEPTMETFFNPESSDYLSYQAWFVKTENDAGIEYNYTASEDAITWHTGDLLIIHKQALGDSIGTVEQWKNIMGGYFKPTSTYTTHNNGTITRTYSKAPTAGVDNTETADSPIITWKPTSHNNGEVTFTPYWTGDNPTKVSSLGTTTIKNITFSTRGRTNSYTLYGTETDCEISNVFDLATNETLEDVGYDIHFSLDGTVVANGLPEQCLAYFPYEVWQDGSKLFIRVSRGSYTNGTIYLRVNIFKS